ncbi:hypothetical protein GGI35DRAFT_489022 [Trichoderma velutinum]
MSRSGTNYIFYQDLKAALIHLTKSTLPPEFQNHLFYISPPQPLLDSGCWCNKAKKPYPHNYTSCPNIRTGPYPSIIGDDAHLQVCDHLTSEALQSRAHRLFCFEPARSTEIFMDWFMRPHSFLDGHMDVDEDQSRAILQYLYEYEKSCSVNGSSGPLAEKFDVLCRLLVDLRKKRITREARMAKGSWEVERVMEVLENNLEVKKRRRRTALEENDLEEKRGCEGRVLQEDNPEEEMREEGRVLQERGEGRALQEDSLEEEMRDEGRVFQERGRGRVLQEERGGGGIVVLQEGNLEEDNLEEDNLEEDNLEEDNLEEDNLEEEMRDEDPVLEKNNTEETGRRRGTVFKENDTREKRSGSGRALQEDNPEEEVRDEGRFLQEKRRREDRVLEEEGTGGGTVVLEENNLEEEMKGGGTVPEENDMEDRKYMENHWERHHLDQLI